MSCAGGSDGSAAYFSTTAIAHFSTHSTAAASNCPRYIPKLELATPSPYTPRAGQDFVEPDWKSYDEFKDVVPPRVPTYRG